MKFTITMKDPDGFHHSVRDAAKCRVPTEGLSDDEVDLLTDERVETLNELLKQWFRYSEYVDIEIDTDAKTATVLLAK